MSTEIKHVKEKTDDIFEAVLSSNASKIDEFIIVTFNDPDVHFRVKTNHTAEFKRALRRIEPYGGQDCPEMALKGIELALKESKPNSFLYAFTDASAKDYEIYGRVKSLALEKSIQITFLLTGECKDTNEKQHTVYDRLAAATLGQVFHIEKIEIGKIINYVLANLRSTRTILLRKSYRNRCDHYKFTVDSKVWDILIALSAPRPLLNFDLIVLGPDGNKALTSNFINSTKTTIFKLEGIPGEYSIIIKNCEGITVLVSAATSVSFRHGFSSTTPSSLDETSTKPLSGKKSYLAIALDNDERDVTLKTLEIRDMDDKLIQQLMLKLVDKENQFYITDLLTPPKEAYTIAISGYTKFNEKITRLSQTSTEYHSPEINARKPAVVTVIGSNEILAEYNGSVMLKCKVNGYPRPQISWSDEFHKVWQANVTKISPYEYISYLYIDRVTMNVTFTCTAENSVKSSDYVSVIVGKRSFIDVLEYPKDVSVEYGEPVELNLKIDARPPATIIWYQVDKEIQNNDEFHVSEDGSHLKIMNVQPRLQGKYSVEATNGDKKVKYEFNVTLNDTEPLIQTPEKSEFDANLTSTLVLPCHVTGYPIPTVIWLHNGQLTYGPNPNQTDFVEGNYSITLRNIQPKDEGVYTCRAVNKNNKTEIKYTVNVLVPATIISNLGTKNIELVKGDLYFNLSCNATGNPKPDITWTLNGTKVGSDGGFKILDEGTLMGSNVTLSHKGTYSCKAENKVGSALMEYEVNVHEFPPIEDIKKTSVILIITDSTQNISCGTQTQKGDLARWFKDCKFINTGEIHTLVNVTKADAGYYTCRLSNLQRPSFSKHYRVSIGTKPKFLTDANTRVAFKAGAKAHLDCVASGDPPPTANWFKDNVRINIRATQYTFIMNASNIGEYKCLVANEFDTIVRNFSIVSDEECLMDLKKDFTPQQPFLLENLPRRKQPEFNISGEFLRMSKYKKFKLVCPSSVISYNKLNYTKELEITCVANSMFKLGDRDVKASEITCVKAINPISKCENNTCLGTNTQFFSIGFDVEGSKVYVFKVCFNEKTKTPIFVNHAIHRAIANTIPEHVANYTSGIPLPFQFEEIYDCRKQLDAISSFTGKPLKSVEDEKCCFKRRQLVNPKDVLPGISQVATYHYLNVVPQWNACGNTENWDEVERRVRNFAFGFDGKMAIWTGAASVVKNVSHITLKDKLNQTLEVPQFIWKVVENKLAIIHINVPGLTSLEDVSPYILCKDICETVPWMKTTQWHDVNRGYIYCCNVKEFEKAFDYESTFGRMPVGA